MESFHVIDILVNRPHMKSTVYLPTCIRHVTGVLFFPVIQPDTNGIPDGDPLGTAGVSLENEKLNVVTNARIFKKSPIYFESTDYATAQGEIFLDRGYTRHDFFQCNDPVAGNSFLVFTYTNRKMVVSLNSIEQFNINYNRLKSLVGKDIVYRGMYEHMRGLEQDGDILKVLTQRSYRTFEIHKNDLAAEIYEFLDPEHSNDPFFSDEDSEEYDKAFTMKIILKYDR